MKLVTDGLFIGTIEPCFRTYFAVHHRINAFNVLHVRSDVQLVTELVSLNDNLVTLAFLAKITLTSLNSSKYPVERKTLNHRISYYVKDNFGTEYQGSLGRLESAVEEEYIVNMKRACFSEKNYREAMMSRARSFGSRTQYAQAQALKTPSCDALYKLGVSGRY